MQSKVQYVVYRYGHHSQHSGYDRLADFWINQFGGEKIVVNKPLSKRIIRERILWYLAKGTPGYDRSAMAAELKVAMKMLADTGRLFHFLYGETTYHYAGLLRGMRKNHLVATFHLPPSDISKSFQIDWPIQCLSALVCVGNNQIEYFSRVINQDRIFYVPHGVDAGYFTPPTAFDSRNQDLCLIVGENYRDYPTLRGVIELVSYIRPKTKFVILTSPRNRELLGTHPNIVYKSAISEAELLKLYQSASVLLMPLLDATANNAILEGMSCGLPVVVTDVGAVRDYVDSACGMLMKPNQAKAMAEAVIDLLNNDSERTKMSLKCREQALKFTWEESVGKLKSIYEALA